jgi:XTP/dITP diphosphohydrolase
MKKLLVASGNQGKIREISALLAGVIDNLLTPADFSGLPEVIEDGSDFKENACKKALVAARATGVPVIADDSGLVVDALNGQPGVYSARYAGEGAGDTANNAKLLGEMASISAKMRTAAFHCVIALCTAEGDCVTFTGELKGVLLSAPRGRGGFGYDPLFLVPEYGLTLAELPLMIKNKISHRGQALLALKEYLIDNQG